MAILDHARRRITAVLEEVDRLKQSEFPYPHPRLALEILEANFKRVQRVLEKISPSEPPDKTIEPCVISLDELFTYVPFLGFILRSTNVRNSFESYAPLLRLSRSILGPETKLIVSSEWDYSPYVYSSINHLPGFVMIGLPAPESANPLLIPLAGHELGHSIWASQSYSENYKDQIEKLVLEQIVSKQWKDYELLYPQFKKDHFTKDDLISRSIWLTAYTWSMLQAEEIFCDFIGVRLFAESYLHAFEYLLSPGFPGERSVRYPNMASRVSHLLTASKEMNIEFDPGFANYFRKEDEFREPSAKLLSSTADTVSASLVPDLIKLAQDFITSKNVLPRNPEKVSEIRDDFHLVIPTSRSQSLCDIMNAGWQCYLEKELWTEIPQINQNERHRILKDIILKSLEVSEAYERLREP